jgi:hypothetical protein
MARNNAALPAHASPTNKKTQGASPLRHDPQPAENSTKTLRIWIPQAAAEIQ